MGPAEAAIGHGRAGAVRWRGVCLFVLLAFGIAWGGFFGLRGAGIGPSVWMLFYISAPGLAALLVRGPLGREGFGDAGLRLSWNGRPDSTYLLAYATVPILFALGAGLAVATGTQRWLGLDGLRELLIEQPGWLALTTGLSTDQVLILAVGINALVLPVVYGVLVILGEEFGWRGYLLPRLAPLGGPPAALLTGVVSGLWHAPVVATLGLNFPGHPWVGAAMMVAVDTAVGPFLAWLRFRSGSIWPATLAHAVGDPQAALLGRALSGGDRLLGAPEGVLGLVPWAMLGAWLILTGRLGSTPAPGPRRGLAMPATDRSASPRQV